MALAIVSTLDQIIPSLLKGYMKIAYEQSKVHGPEARKFTVIFDMDNFSMKPYVYRPAAEMVITTFQMYSNNYPEILKYCYIINGMNWQMRRTKQFRI